MTCTISKRQAKTTPHLIQCLHCSESVHVDCIHAQFKEVKNEPLENKVGWLHDFIKFASLAHRCKACLEKCKVAPIDLTAQEKYGMIQSIAFLDAKVSLFHRASVLSNGGSQTILQRINTLRHGLLETLEYLNNYVRRMYYHHQVLRCAAITFPSHHK